MDIMDHPRDRLPRFDPLDASIVTVPEAGYEGMGGLRLRASDLDVEMQGNGVWLGAGGPLLNTAICSHRGFLWPVRVDTLNCVEATIEIGDLRDLARAWAWPLEQVTTHVAIEWPIGQRQARIPSGFPFRIVSKPGGRIQGRLLEAIT